MINWSEPRLIHDYLNLLWQMRQPQGTPLQRIIGLRLPGLQQQMSESPPPYITADQYLPLRGPGSLGQGLPNPNSQMADTQKPYAGPMPQTPSASPQAVQNAPSQPSYSTPVYKTPSSQSMSTPTPNLQGVVPASWYR